MPVWQIFSITMCTIPAATSSGLDWESALPKLDAVTSRFNPGSFSLDKSPTRKSIFATSPLRDRAEIS